MKNIFILSFSLLLAATNSLLSQVSSNPSKTNGDISPRYYCPMKCEGEKTYYKPGQCPVCKMNLEIVKSKEVKIISNVNRSVRLAGEMKSVMMKNDLTSNINLDTIANKQHLYGMGPLESMSGEITIMDGRLFISEASSGNSIVVSQPKSFSVKAPFFGYTNVDSWNQLQLPDSISTIQQIDSFVNSISSKQLRPFFFLLKGAIDSAMIHVVNLPAGTREVSPNMDMHKESRTYKLAGEQVEILGFFSTDHAGIFTHRSTYTHLHLLTLDKKKMGHVDKLYLKKGKVQLSMPVNK